MKRQSRLVALLALSTAAQAPNVAAETIRLNAGGTIGGTILSITDHEITIQWGPTKRSILKSDVAPPPADAVRRIEEFISKKEYREADLLSTQLMIHGPADENAARLRQEIHRRELEQLIHSFNWAAFYGSSLARLYEIATEKDLPQLHHALTNHANSRGRRAMTWVLADVRSEESVLPLIDALTQDGDSRVRREAAFALGEIGSPQAVSPLIRKLRTDENAGVRLWAGWALHNIGTRTALAALKSATPLEKDGATRGRLDCLVANPRYDRHECARIDPGQVTIGYCKGTAYALYVPTGYDPHKPPTLLASIHGSYGWPTDYAWICKDEAEKHGTVVVAPHFEFHRFPGHGLLNIGRHRKIRADLRLLDIIDHLAGCMSIRRDRFLLYGHSEGGQFVHRFVLAHPDRVLRAAAAGVGSFVTPEPDIDFPFGLRMNAYAQDLGQLDWANLVESPLAIVLGTNDSAGHQAGATAFMNAINEYADKQDLTCNVRFLPVIGGIHCGAGNFTMAREFLFADDLSRFDENRDGPLTIERRHLLALSGSATARTSSEWDASYTADRIMDGDFATRWAGARHERGGWWVELTWPEPVRFDRVTIDECVDYGPRIQAWRLEAGIEDLHEIARGDGLGARHKVALPRTVKATRLRLTIETASETPTIWEFMPHMAFWEK